MLILDQQNINVRIRACIYTKKQAQTGWLAVTIDGLIPGIYLMRIFPDYIPDIIPGYYENDGYYVS